MIEIVLEVSIRCSIENIQTKRLKKPNDMLICEQVINLMKKSELALAPKLFQKSVVKYLHDSNFDPKYPWVVELDPTTACNLACPDCISGTLLGQGGFLRKDFWLLSMS